MRDQVSAASFERECAGLLASTWTYAGMADEVARHNDFLRLLVAGVDLLIQNFNGQLRAFINSCSHRHSLIHTEPHGNRALVCPYHGWAYDERGAPTGIPLRQEFPQVCADPDAWRLDPVELARAGDFLFVRLKTGGEPLESFLGDAFGFLEQVSAALDRTLDDFRSTIRANWKIVIENSLEGYHVPLVHRETLGRISQFSRERTDIIDHLVPQGHSYMTNLAHARWLARWQGYENDLGQWPFRFEHYVHRLVFPILTVTSFLGYSFHVQRFQPDAHDSTTVHSRIYSTRFSGQTERGARIIDTIYRENVDFTRRIFEEDRRACELTHAGSLQATRPSVLAASLEQRIADFRRTCARHG